MAQSKQCLRCGGTLVEGFVVDQAHGGAATVPTWVEGAPQKSVWTGVKLGGKAKLDIAAWRCRSCGLLEQYAAAGPSQHQQAQQRAMRVVVVVALVTAVLLAVLGIALALWAD